MARILVAEDSASLLELFELILGIKGHEVYKADGRDNMFKQLYSVCPDVIFMDVILGNYDGRDLCSIIQDGPYKDVPVILMSATRTLLYDFKKFGASAILEKPFDIREIVRLVAFTLNRKNNMTRA